MANITVTTSGGATTLVSIGSRGPAGPAGTGGGGGGVTSVATGTGLTGGPVTTTGTIALANTAVTAGLYQAPFIQVDAQGRLTKALDEPCDDEIHFSGGASLNTTNILTATGVAEWTTPVVSAVARTGIFSGITTGTDIALIDTYTFSSTAAVSNFLQVTGGGFNHVFNVVKSEIIVQSSTEIITRLTGSVTNSSGTALPTRPAIAIFRRESTSINFTLTLKVQKEFLYTGTSPVVVTGRAISLSTTLPSAYEFTNATRPTSSGTSAPASNSLITYNDFLREQLFSLTSVRRLRLYQYFSANSGAASQFDGDNISCAAVASSNGGMTFTRILTHAGSLTGGNTKATVPLLFSVMGCFDLSTSTNAKIRFLVGVASGTAPAANVDALSGTGAGWEIFYSSTNSRVEIRLINHNSTYNEGTPVAFPVSAAGTANVILEIVGDGTLNLYASTSTVSEGICLRPSNTAISTMTNAATTGRYSNNYTTLSAVATNTAPVSTITMKIQEVMVKVF
jgi:hypothetical protein